MIGCIAESTSEKFKLDEIEIDEGGWFTRKELEDAINGSESSKFFVPPKMAIAHHLIKAFVENK
jgi:NAD+ diphosphatase